ncbi:PI-PLC X domain-containing protein 1-like [Tropilaelaps mercedesae]|uniref:PI-PLC X domain-containing protein 1-like n=1 Tax=Tropilaelaps mercedesae TaxID=418985 RepID=A0A1V9X6Y8_9ACAR|nr:PI-PLC X domain-containing protein 1-like [Tropilaelaps mercedesae]
MVHIYPTSWTLKTETIRNTAAITNFNISSWFASDAMLRSSVNMLAVEYFASSDIVNLCIDINVKRGISFQVLYVRTGNESKDTDRQMTYY